MFKKSDHKPTKVDDTHKDNNTPGNNHNNSTPGSKAKHETHIKGKTSNSKSLNKKQNTSYILNSSKSKYLNNPAPTKDNPYLIPIIFIIAILPLIVRLHDYKTPLSQYPWFVNKSYTDFFLYYKHWLFVATSFIMSIIIFKRRNHIKDNKFIPTFIPLAVYALLALLSSVLSKYRGYSFTGIYEQFESVFAILGYCLVVYYVFLFVQTENDIAAIIKWLLISTLILIVLGLTQLSGHDFFGTTMGTKLITPPSYWGNPLDLKFEKIYLTLYNPNYVGLYVSLVLPIFLCLVILSKTSRYTIYYIVASIGLLLCLYGSGSTSGFIALALGVFILLIFLWRYYLKYYYISIPVAIIVIISIISILSFNGKARDYVNHNIDKVTSLQKSSPALTDIQTNEKELVIVYNKNKLFARFSSENNNLSLSLTDEGNKAIPYETNSETGSMTVQDTRFPGFVFTPLMYNDILGFKVLIDNNEWPFTNQYNKDGSYYYINACGNFVKIIAAPSAVFTGYENYASGRGYIWSRTIPLLKKHIILGSGSDTFALEFPHQDYVNAYNYGYGQLFISKPHSLYLQIGAQTGVLSLLAFLIFYIMYFISSVRIYIKGHFESYYAKVGLGLLIGTFCFMVTSIANDSSISVTPVFWVFVGLGIVVNHKAKPLIDEMKVSQSKTDEINTSAKD